MARREALLPERLLQLPNALGRWELGIRPAPKELRRLDGGHVVVVLDARSGTARASDVIAELSNTELLRVVVDAMTRSASGQAACRPRQLAVETRALQQTLAPDLGRCGIKVEHVPMLPLVDEFMQGLRDHLGGQPVRSPIGALVMEKPLAEAAARIAALEPWRHIPGELPLLVANEGDEEAPRVLVVMGQLRNVEGVAAYDDVGQLRRAVDLDQPSGAWCLLFHRASEVPRAVREEFIQLGLPVAHGLYPHFAMLSETDGPARVEDKDDAKGIVADLEALEHYVRDCCHALADARAPARTGLELSNGQRVSVTPRRDLARDQQCPAEQDEAPTGPDDPAFWPDDGNGDGKERTRARDGTAEPDDQLLEALDADLRPVVGAATGDENGGFGEEGWPLAPAAPQSDRLAHREEEPALPQDVLDAAAGVPFGLGDLPYRITLCTVPTGLLRAARGARVALWQTEQRRGGVPDHMPAIVVKMTKRDAETAARKLHRVNRASFQRLSVMAAEHELLVVSENEQDEQVLASWPLSEGAPPPSAWRDEAGSPDGALLLFVSGGAGRALRALAPAAVVAGQHVELHVSRRP